jgi:small-conductance mechanosensitive channel
MIVSMGMNMGMMMLAQVTPPVLPAEAAGFTWRRVIEFLRDVWHFPLFNSGAQTVQLNQIVLAMAIVVVGVMVSKRVSRVVSHRLTRLALIDDNATAFLTRLCFYALAVTITLVALPIAGVPITIFTVLGGALAIGVGFGAQNLINNFISGVILMIERPIRLGDIVEVGDQEGRIEEIRNRCVRVRRFDGIDVLVPNSTFLETNVVNWTLQDDLVRGLVTVGVAYGSPVPRVADLMRQAADQTSGVLREPEPIVIFEEFGDNALQFDVYFWTRVQRPMDLKRIRSAIRFRIDDLFREAGIAIAFPQRDVHLTTLAPLRVRVEQAGASDTFGGAT